LVGFVHNEKVQAHLLVEGGDLGGPHGFDGGGLQQMDAAGIATLRQGVEEREQIPRRGAQAAVGVIVESVMPDGFVAAIFKVVGHDNGLVDFVEPPSR
jgi:hypothetical protein